VGISRELLGEGDVIGVPREEEDEGGVDEADKYGWIENGLPYESRGEDGTTTEDEEEEGGPGMTSSGCCGDQMKWVTLTRPS